MKRWFGVVLCALALAGCFSRAAKPDGSTCINYTPLCQDRCVTDQNGCRSCDCDNHSSVDRPSSPPRDRP